MITKSQLVDDLHKAGIKKGDLLNMKVSLRAVGKLENGADTLIEALLEVLGEEGTFVSDAFVSTKAYFLPFQNKEIVNENTKSYAGAFANAMIKFKGSLRSKHPIQKFVAIGKLAKKLTSTHDETSFAYGVLKDMVKSGGKNVKIGPEDKVPGVGTTHIAICDLNFEQNRLPKGVYYKNEQGIEKFHQVNWVGGCGFGFANLMNEFKTNGAVLYSGKLGNADLKITDMNKTYHIELEKLMENPKTILCSKQDCLDCRVSWSFSEDTYFTFAKKQKSLKKIGAAVYHAIFSKKLKG